MVGTHCGAAAWGLIQNGSEGQRGERTRKGAQLESKEWDHAHMLCTWGLEVETNKYMQPASMKSSG